MLLGYVLDRSPHIQVYLLFHPPPNVPIMDHGGTSLYLANRSFSFERCLMNFLQFLRVGIPMQLGTLLLSQVFIKFCGRTLDLIEYQLDNNDLPRMSRHEWSPSLFLLYSSEGLELAPANKAPPTKSPTVRPRAKY